MQVTLLDAGRIEAEWPVIAELMAPALAVNPNGATTVDQFRADLGSAKLSIVGGDAEGARGYLAFQMFEENGELCCFASYFAGSVDGGPRQMIKTMRALMRAFEASCREAGVVRILIGGRDWGRVFPEYELTGDVPNRRQKRL
jgi:hypothetical protein